MKSKLLWVGGTLLSVVVLVVYLYFALFAKGDTINKVEREAFISRGADKYEITILNGSGPIKVYQAVSKVTSDEIKGYYYFWATINGTRRYVQSPIASTVIEEK